MRSVLFTLVCLTVSAAAFICPRPLRTCGDACYIPKLYCCVNGQLTQRWQCPPDDTDTGDDPIPTTAKPPAPTWKDDGSPDLTIINSCKFNLFVEARMGNDGAPIPGHRETVLRLPAGQSIGYTLPSNGSSGTRFWAKYGCDDNGHNCLIGDSQQYYPNPPGGCPPGGCQIPIDSLFEATWGCKPGTACNAENPTTWWDTSQVDGWTLPYKVRLTGRYDQCDCDGNGNCPNIQVVDGSQLDLRKCPSNEDASWNGKYAKSGNFSMSNIDLRYISNNQVLGCISPCKKLNFGRPTGYSLDEGKAPTLYMCCPTPTPDDCKESNGCIGPQDCRNGPIEQTQFVKAVHAMAPGVYAYSYDDLQGLHACPAGTVKYEMEFCPAGSAPYPLDL